MLPTDTSVFTPIDIGKILEEIDAMLLKRGSEKLKEEEKALFEMAQAVHL